MTPRDEMHTAAMVTLRGRGGRVLTRAGRWLGYLSIPWFFVCAFIEDLFRVGPWRSAPAWTLLGIMAIAIAPAVTWVVVKIVGGHGLLAVFVEAMQPRITLDREGLEVCQPSTGCQRFEWSDIGALENVPRTGIRRVLFAGDPSDGILKGVLGRSLARVPARLMLARREGSRSRLFSLAEVAVELKPELFLVADASLFQRPSTFARRGLTSVEPQRFERTELRSKRFYRVLFGGFVLVFVLTIVWMTSQGPIAPPIR